LAAQEVAVAIPDLWRAKEDAARLYQLYLCRLQMNRLHERVVAVCPQIRRYAARGPGPTEGLFTFSFELDSLCDLKDYRAAWRRVRLREAIVFGKRIDLRSRVWSITDGWELPFSYAPLLFFLGRYHQGCKLLETFLDLCFARRKVRSFDLLFHVYNGDEEPWNRCRVPLSHFYNRLGKDLRQWRHWDAFVNGFHPRLFRLSGVRREELMADSGRLAVFFDKLMDARNERTTSGVGGGQSDLIDSANKVRKRQEAMQRKLDEFRERIKPVQERTNRKLQELFPELRELPK
jgi:hypothetical protein